MNDGGVVFAAWFGFIWGSLRLFSSGPGFLAWFRAFVLFLLVPEPDVLVAFRQRLRCGCVVRSVWFEHDSDLGIFGNSQVVVRAVHLRLFVCLCSSVRIMSMGESWVRASLETKGEYDIEGPAVISKPRLP